MSDKPERDRIIARVMKKGVPKSFEHIVERYEMAGKTSNFHRSSQLVVFNAFGPNAAVGLFLWESNGIALESCSEPQRYEDLLTGKRSLGLSEKMWIEDWDNESLHGLFLPEEFFMQGLIDYDACVALFHGRPLVPEIMWFLARMDEESIQS